MSGRPGNVNLGRLLVAWEAGASKSPEEVAQAFEALSMCGGASLFMTRAEAAAGEKGGIRFDGDPERLIPADGRGHVRVRCRDRVMTKALSEPVPDSDAVRRRVVTYGLCSRCAGYELAIRTRLRRAAEEAEQNARLGGRKRGFREEAAE